MPLCLPRHRKKFWIMHINPAKSVDWSWRGMACSTSECVLWLVCLIDGGCYSSVEGAGAIGMSRGQSSFWQKYPRGFSEPDLLVFCSLPY